MKRMIDGVINCLAESGGYELNDDGSITATIKFCFPEGYWPITLNSKPFSIMPGHINHGDESNISNWCFNEKIETNWSSVNFISDAINYGYGYNYISYQFTFGNQANRTAFLKEIFGKDIKPQEGLNVSPFAVPVSMLLVAFDGSFEY